MIVHFLWFHVTVLVNHNSYYLPKSQSCERGIKVCLSFWNLVYGSEETACTVHRINACILTNKGPFTNTG